MKQIIVKSCKECPILSMGCYVDDCDKVQHGCDAVSENYIVKDINKIDDDCPLFDKPTREEAVQLIWEYMHNNITIGECLTKMGFKEVPK